MKKSDMTVLGCFGLLVYFIAVMVIASVAGGWALSTLWGWFVVPILHLPAITVVEAIGLSIVVGVFKSGSLKQDDENKDKGVVFLMTKALLASILTPALSVFIGWIVLQFMH